MPGLLALVTVSVFFGAAVYINIAEHPARLALPDAAALAEWGPAYRRGFAMQAPIAVASALLGACAWWTTGERLWGVGAVIMIANWSYTLLAIMPTNRRFEATPPGADADTRGRLVRWGQLHAVRSALGAAAMVVYLIAAQRSL
jgi:Domain of unknown function (DUF1772)